MKPQKLLTFLLGSAVSATYFDNSTATHELDVTAPIPYCADLTFPTNGSFQETYCTIKPENIANFQFALSQTYTGSDSDFEITSDDPILSRRGGNTLPPVVPENGRLLWKEASDTSTPSNFKQCVNNGPTPKIKDVQKLCSKVDSSYIIRRAGQNTTDPQAGPCVCKVWSYNSAVFSVCNCDSCDALVITSGLKDKCREISQHCTTQGYSSGYIKMPDVGSMYEQHMAEKGDKKDVKIELGDLTEAMKLTCKSGNETRVDQDRMGEYIRCKKVRGGKKCWRTTDPKNVWYQS